MARVSIITELSAGGRFIGQMAASLIAQSFKDWELVVVANKTLGNTSKTVRFLASRDPRIRVVWQGPATTWEMRAVGFAVTSAESEYLLFLSPSDTIDSDFLATMADYLDRHENVGVVYCGLKTIEYDGRAAPPNKWTESRRLVPAGLGYRVLDNEREPETPLFSLLSNFQAFPTSTLFRRSTYQQAGGWTDGSERGYDDDKDLVMRCSLIAPVHYLNMYMASRRQGVDFAPQSNRAGQGEFDSYWLSGRFLAPHERAITRRSIGFKRRVAGLVLVAAARNKLTSRQLSAGLRDLVHGFKLLAKSPLAAFGI